MYIVPELLFIWCTHSTKVCVIYGISVHCMLGTLDCVCAHILCHNNLGIEHSMYVRIYICILYMHVCMCT
jgi:hypothetical protein